MGRKEQNPHFKPPLIRGESYAENLFFSISYTHTTHIMEPDYFPQEEEESTPPPNQLAGTQTTLQHLQTLFQEIPPAKPSISSIAPWIVPILQKHSNRVVELSRLSEANRISIKRLEKGLESRTFPPTIEILKAPKAIDGPFGLQEIWDNLHTEYQTSLVHALITAKKQKIDSHLEKYSASGIVVTEFIAELKSKLQEINTESESNSPLSKNPRNLIHWPVPQVPHLGEVEAVLNFWSLNKEVWVQQGITKASREDDDRENKKQKRESVILETTNVRQSPHNQTQPLTTETGTLHKFPGQEPSKPFLIIRCDQESAKQRKTDEERNNQGQIQRQRQRLPQTIASSIRRKSKKDLNLLNKLHTLHKRINISNEEQKMMRNIQRLGVSHTAISNLTRIRFSEKDTEALALGHKFIPIPDKQEEVIAESMHAFIKTVRLRWKHRQTSQDPLPKYWIPSTWYPRQILKKPQIEVALIQLRKNLNNSTNKEGETPFNIHPHQLKTLRRLLDREDLIVITADKNLGYVIVETSWYRQKCLEYLNSKDYSDRTVEFLKDDEGIHTTNQIYQELIDMIHPYQDILDGAEYKWIIKKEEWKPMKFYLLAKVHKQPVKGRPIVPSMTWITHHLSEWLSNQLNPLLENLDWVLKDSNDLLRKLHNLKIKNPKKLTLMTADVEALYPSMDISTGLQIMKEFLEEIGWETPKRQELALKAMEFVLTKGYMQFENRIFQQNNGAAMGSPMIPPYANIFMFMIERGCVEKYTSNQLLMLYVRYIDDVFTICEQNTALINSFIKDMNELNENIRLVWTSPDIKCDFLDISLELNHQGIKTKVFQKPLNRYSYLPWKSYHTKAQKQGFIKAETLRYARICSSRKDFNLMKKLFTLRLQRRGYPLSMIHSVMDRVKWNQRIHNLFKKKKNKGLIPFLFKTEFNPIIEHKKIRKCLDIFTKDLEKISGIPQSLKEKITICYSLPPTMHSLVLRARKSKGL